MLALPRYAIVKRQADGSNAPILIGTGSYKLNQWQSGEHAQFTANEDYWGGRSFADTIEFQMGSTIRDQLMDRQLGSYAATELSVDQIRTWNRTTRRLPFTTERSAGLLFLQPDSGGRPGRKPVDARVRQALDSRQSRCHQQFHPAKESRAGHWPAAAMAHGLRISFPGQQGPDRAKELRAEAAAVVIVPSLSPMISLIRCPSWWPSA